MQYLTDLIIFLLAVESIFKILQSALLYLYFRQSLESDYPAFEFSPAMSDTQSLHTSLLEVMMSSKSERVFLCDLSDLTLQISFDAWWASKNVGSKRPIAWKNSRHAPLWRFYLHCGIEETGSPGIICIIYHQVLRHPSEHGTSSMRKHLLVKAHIAKLNKLTKLEITELNSSTVDETALAILKRQGSREITIVSLKRKTIYDIQLNPY
jgi:hypothetical protein